LYDGGFGGKKANLAAMDDVTPPIFSTFANAWFSFQVTPKEKWKREMGSEDVWGERNGKENEKIIKL
jgi:hypothetical protein